MIPVARTNTAQAGANVGGMPGAGLGLAIVGQVAQAHGGSVRVNTGPGGTTFVLNFPSVPPHFRE